MATQHVIVGAGPAGVIAAETLKDIDNAASVVLLGDEPEPPYSRMALPYYLIKQIKEEGTHLRKTADHFSALGIDLRQDRVASVDTQGKQLAMASGDTLPYDRLLICTGSRPVSPPVPGIDMEGIYTCWTLADGRNIIERARPGAKVVLLGAGFIGCIILEALARSGAELTVVEMEDRMVPRMMNDKAGNLIKSWCIEHGVNVHTSTRAEEIKPGSSGTRFDVVLSTGETIPADMIVQATGVKPNIDLLEGTGIETNLGILVNEHMQTSDPSVFAAGDVAEGRDFSTGEYSVQAIQPTAADHGLLAARNMAGLGGARHQGSVNMNVLDTLGLISSSFGLWMGADGGESTELYDPERYRYLNLQFEDDILVGATSLGLTQHVGVMRGLIQSKTHLGKWKERLMDDPTRIMEAYLANTQAIGFNSAVFK